MTIALARGADAAKQSYIACGWSPRRARMVGVLCVQTAESAGFAVTEIRDGGYVQPGIDASNPAVWHERLAKLPLPNSPQAMGRYAQEQARIIKEFIPDIHAGGRFLIAELARDLMKIRPVAEL